MAFPWLCDQMGHLTTSSYVEMFDVAAYNLLFTLGDRPPGDGSMGWADVRQTIDYRADVPVGALVLIRSGVLDTGRTSFRARHVMTDPAQQKTHAVMESATVRFDLCARKACPLPQEFLADAAHLRIGPEDPSGEHPSSGPARG